VRQELNSRLRAQEDKRKEFLKAQDEFRKFQVHLPQKMDVAPKDVGAGQ
jgi:hypothetical protein